MVVAAISSRTMPRLIHLLTRGLKQLVAKYKLDTESVVMWIDFGCVDQDDTELQAKGINSLIAYAAQSSYVLTPVHPSPADTAAFSKATHPGQLVNYGERAWCRIESYVFLCLAEAETSSIATVMASARPLLQRRSSDRSHRRLWTAMERATPSRSCPHPASLRPKRTERRSRVSRRRCARRMCARRRSQKRLG